LMVATSKESKEVAAREQSVRREMRKTGRTFTFLFQIIAPKLSQAADEC